MTSISAAASRAAPVALPTGTLPQATSVLAVTARPGLEAEDLGGLLYAFRRVGANMGLLCLTRGEASPWNSTLCARLEVVRPWELQLAAAILGISSVTIASYPDGGLHRCLAAELTDRIRHAIDKQRADLLLVIAPEVGDRGNAVVAIAACAAARQAGVPVVASAGPEAHGAWAVDLGADAATARAIQKSAAAAHESQSQALPGLIRRLDLFGNQEQLRWLVPPPQPVERDQEARQH